MNILSLKTLSKESVDSQLGEDYVPEAAASQLLDWISDQDVHFAEDNFSFAGKDVFRFQSSAKSGATTMYGFGRSESRRLAAIKSSAELIERMAYHSFVKSESRLNLCLKVEMQKWSISSSTDSRPIEKSFHNSNGWAVDFSAKGAIDRAVREALERHILLLSYIKHGWSGFFQIDETKISHFNFRSLVSKYSVAGFTAGIGICQSPAFQGASFGYLSDQSDKILTSEKWEQSFYEAFDYIRMREDNPKANIQNDLISKELEYFLNKPFIEVCDERQKTTELSSKATADLAVIDLKESLDLPFPFFAAVVHGGDLLPLYLNQSLTESGRLQLQKTLKNISVDAVYPERHPIL